MDPGVFNPATATWPEIHSQAHARITALGAAIESISTEIADHFKRNDPMIKELVQAIIKPDVFKGKNKRGLLTTHEAEMAKGMSSNEGDVDATKDVSSSEGDTEEGRSDTLSQDEISFEVAEWSIKELALELKKGHNELRKKIEKMNALIEERKELIDMLLDAEWDEHLRREEMMKKMGQTSIDGSI